MNVGKVVTVAVQLALVLGLGMLSACSSEQLPNGAQLRVSPGSKSIHITAPFDTEVGCIVNPLYYQDIPLIYSLTDGQDSPIGHANISVYADYSGNTTALQTPVLQVYQDKNGNGVVDEETELVSDTDSAIFSAKTSSFGGELMVLLRINLSCPYKGTIYAYAGSATASMDVEVTYDDSETTDDGTADDDTTDENTTDTDTDTDEANAAGVSSIGSSINGYTD